MALAIILFPLLMALLALAIRSNHWRPWVLPVTGVVHASLTGVVLGLPALSVSSVWLELDPPGRLVLAIVSGLFLVCSFYTVGYLRHREERPNKIFCACLCAFLAMLSLVTWAHHMGLMWVAIEATALTTAPLIYFNQTPRSIEATWKYLLIGSIGIALALLGSFFLAYSMLNAGLEPSLVW